MPILLEQAEEGQAPVDGRTKPSFATPTTPALAHQPLFAPFPVLSFSPAAADATYQPTTKQPVRREESSAMPLPAKAPDEAESRKAGRGQTKALDLRPRLHLVCHALGLVCNRVFGWRWYRRWRRCCRGDETVGRAACRRLRRERASGPWRESRRDGAAVDVSQEVRAQSSKGVQVKSTHHKQVIHYCFCGDGVLCGVC